MVFIKRLSLFLLVTATIFSTSFAQKVSLDQFKSWKPRNIGPAGMSGRITAIEEGKISLIEIVPDGMGGFIERPAALALSE